MSSIEDHLRSRGIDPQKTAVIMDSHANIATFLLYNLSGQLIGYQQYNPAAAKLKHNDLAGRYYTQVTQEGDHNKKLAVWGLESIHEHDRMFFVTEGIFDCAKIHN